MRTTSLILGVLLAAVALNGCKKKEETAAADSAAPAPEAAPAAPAPADSAAPAEEGGDGDVEDCPGQTPMSGTVRVKINFNAYKKTDLASEKVGTIPAGTLIDLKATCSNWMLVEFPVGVGELGPGWIQLPNINDSRVSQATEQEKKERPKLRVREPKKKREKKDPKVKREK